MPINVPYIGQLDLQQQKKVEKKNFIYKFNDNIEQFLHPGLHKFSDQLIPVFD